MKRFRNDIVEHVEKNCSESKGPSFDMKKKGLPSTWL